MALAFAAATLIGTALLMLPVATVEPGSARPIDALFTSTSALCVTGLAVVDTRTHWSTFGHCVILLLIQLGGLGIMTLASLLAVVVSRRLGLRSRLIAQTETGAMELGSVRRLIRRIVTYSLAIEAVGFVVLTGLFWTRHDLPAGEATFTGLFHSVSAFNNAGFSTFPDSLVGSRTDLPLISAIMVLIVIGGLGIPVLQDLSEGRARPGQWSLHTKVTVLATSGLVVLGALSFAAFEWSNPATIGDLDLGEKVINSLFGAVTPRTAGFNTVDYGAVEEGTLLVTQVLMFIGGSSASTAGGIKVTTFALLGYVIWAELRGEPDVNVFGRRVPESAQRQAVTVALLGVGAAVGGALVLGAVTPHGLSDVLFESVSALSTTGLSTGITAALPDAAHLALVVLMFVGRVGPVTAGTALVLRTTDRRYRYPEGRPLIG